jgi:DNA-binding Xre family transcriptional regulator
MLLLDLYRVFEDKGIEHPARFMKQNGFTAHTTFRLLNNKVDSISFRHLEQLCLLLNCSVEDLFSWHNETISPIYNNHPLRKLKRGERKGNITNQLKTLPLDKLNDIRNYIDQLSKTD